MTAIDPLELVDRFQARCEELIVAKNLTINDLELEMEQFHRNLTQIKETHNVEIRKLNEQIKALQIARAFEKEYLKSLGVDIDHMISDLMDLRVQEKLKNQKELKSHGQIVVKEEVVVEVSPLTSDEEVIDSSSEEGEKV